MASTTPTNNQPNNQSINPVPPDALRELNAFSNYIREINTDQGDYNDLLKESIKSLSSQDKLYTKINARLNTLKESSINIKELESEQNKLLQSKYIQEKNLFDLSQKLGENTVRSYENQLNLFKLIAEEEAFNAGIRLTQKELDNQIIAQLKEHAELTGDIEMQAYAAQKKQIEFADEQIKKGKERLKIENEVKDKLGISGNLVKIMADNLGVGTEAYGAMVKKARELQAEQATLPGFVKFFANRINIIRVGLTGLAAAGKQMFKNMFDPALQAAALLKLGKFAASSIASGMNAITGTGGPIAGLTSGVSGLIKQIPLVGGLLGGVVDIFSNLLDFAVGSRSEIHKMGREINLSAQESVNLNNQFSDFAINSGKAYLNSKELFLSQVAISKELGINNQISKENLQTQVELSKFLGVDASTFAEIQKSSTITGKSAKNITSSIIGQVEGFKKATGVSLNYQHILKEAASFGGALGLAFAKYPEKIAKSVVLAKGLGTNLKELDGIADSFLDFESSISKEFEAQLLTGKELNFAKARELFLNNDLVGAGQEITKQLGSASEFLNMNRIQQESIASSIGMSRDQLADMLKQQELLARTGSKDVKQMQEKIKLLRAQGKEQEAINLLGGQEAYNKTVTATASEDLAGFMDKLKQSFADMVANSKLTDFVQNIIGWLSKPENIKNMLNGIKNFFVMIADVTGKIIGNILRFINAFTHNIDESLIQTVLGAGEQMKSFDMGNLAGTASVGNAAAAGTVAASPSANNNNTQANNNKISGVNLAVYNTIEPINGRIITQALNKDTGIKHDGTKMQ
jgi:mRNA-degrading endonuclease HigB of HigAB toxin-antitoxin module